MSDDRIFPGTSPSVGTGTTSNQCVSSPSICTGISPFAGGFELLLIILLIILLLCFIGSCCFGGFALAN
ncbi:MAG TPA: hypothetical protein DCE02_02865 [Ruminiclostridium sp.]|uniref:YjcZ family sporulation protein n=1 Tax=Acetivibrio saccincola TaxID=1677857 RepID=A0A2K9E666_9FIRM|nr:hypothetical protein [Acetivibrio saccincola]HAA42935.1 hypothetical protein [Ruminiclostridium sp.]AUG56956.1 hypothetical protein HVS_05115 [Acetivibrio saccincola]NLW25947.1 hypothetical protein [Acetivibrio saccincola]PQQ66979.1 hypothetical protein B9R14_09670 [Acetivibrio saccincola]HQD29302.1 hypothetical protein [Acetivibrio saccincola]